MNSSNPFYVQPGGDWGTGLSGLAGTLRDQTEKRKAEEKELLKAEKYAKLKSGVIEAMRSGDHMKMLELSISNPEISQAMSNTFKMQSGLDEKEAAIQEKEYSDALFQWTQDPTEEMAQRIIEERKDLNLPGSDKFLERLRANPEQAKNSVMNELAIHSPKRLKAFYDAQKTEEAGSWGQVQEGVDKAGNPISFLTDKGGNVKILGDVAPAKKAGKWQSWGYGQMRNMDTGETVSVQTKPSSGETIRSLPGGGFEIIRGDAKTPKKFTEQQAKTGGFATRVESANKILDGLDKKAGFDPTSITETVAGKIPLIGNLLSSEDKQVHEQAKQNFITAVLRLESGAAIGAEEYEKEDKKYFPQPGDGKEVIENKRKAREQQLEILKDTSGGAYEYIKGGSENKEPEQEPETPKVSPPQAAVDALLKNPQYRDHFIEKYGEAALPEGI